MIPVMLSVLLSPPAEAGDLATFVGGAAHVSADATAAGDTLGGEAEVDLRAEQGPLYIRVDLDYQSSLTDPATDGDTVLAEVMPEWAMVKATIGPGYVKAGVVTAGIGLEDWDPWNNYLPTYSLWFAGGSPGRLIGGQAGLTVGDGGDLFAFGGYDVDYGAVAAGAGINVEQDAWGTYSGLAVYPSLDYDGDGTAGAFLEVVSATELYPSEKLTLTLDGGVGLNEGHLVGAAQLLGVLLPEGIVSPTLRVEGRLDPDAFSGLPAGTASAGAKSTLFDHLVLMGEAKETFFGDGVNDFGLYVSVTGLIAPPDGDTARFED